MAKQASLAKSETVKPAPTAEKAKPETDDKPVAALAPGPAAAKPKRRGRPPGKSNGKKAKPARADILFMVETEEGSDRYEVQAVKTVAEMFDLLDENRKLVATRTWREF